MSSKSQDEKCFLNMAGEFLVAGELNRRHILCAVTYGTAKSADVWAFDSCSSRAARVEVKTTGPDSKKVVIGEKPLKSEASPDVFYVLVQLPEPLPPETTEDAERGQHAPRFFVFRSEEMKALLGDADTKYRATHRNWRGRGVPQMELDRVREFENRWDKIEERVKSTDLR